MKKTLIPKENQEDFFLIQKELKAHENTKKQLALKRTVYYTLSFVCFLIMNAAIFLEDKGFLTGTWYILLAIASIIGCIVFMLMGGNPRDKITLKGETIEAERLESFNKKIMLPMVTTHSLKSDLRFNALIPASILSILKRFESIYKGQEIKANLVEKAAHQFVYFQREARTYASFIPLVFIRDGWEINEADLNNKKHDHLVIWRAQTQRVKGTTFLVPKKYELKKGFEEIDINDVLIPTQDNKLFKLYTDNLAHAHDAVPKELLRELNQFVNTEKTLISIDQEMLCICIPRVSIWREGIDLLNTEQDLKGLQEKVDEIFQVLEKISLL